MTFPLREERTKGGKYKEVDAMKIVGISKPFSFTPKDGKTEISGSTIYTTEPMDPKRGQGEVTDHFFLSTAKLEALDFTPAVGQTVEPLYSRFGKVASLRLLSDDGAIDFGGD